MSNLNINDELATYIKCGNCNGVGYIGSDKELTLHTVVGPYLYELCEKCHGSGEISK